MSTPILRGLAKAYGEGLIDRKQYIHERRQLIDDIVAGHVEIVPYAAPTRERNPELERTFSDGEATMEIPRVDPEAQTVPVAAPKPNRAGLVAAVIVVCAAAIYGGWRLLDNPATPRPTQHAATPVVPPAAAPNPAGILLENFLVENNWRAERIEGFLLAWEGESATSRAALANTPAMRRAADLITQQIVEEQALFELGEREEALRKQRRLLDLADALSITNDRIVRQETSWQKNNAIEAAPRVATTPATPAAAETSPAGQAPVDVPVDVPVALSTQPEADVEPPIATPVATPAKAIEPEPEPETETETETANAIPAAASEPRLTESPEPSAVQPATTVAAPSAPAVPTAQPATKRSGCRAELAKKRRPYCRDVLDDKLNGPTLVVLPAGEASIGGARPEERPQRVVTIDRPFGIGVYEVSFDEFSAFCRATNHSCPVQPWSDRKFPVVNIDWSLAVAYTQWLSEMSGATYRLPTESEWEYAARGGTTTPYPFGDEILPTHARFSFRGPETTPVAADDRTVNRNKFRLYHMVGNVREWVLDVWHDDHSGAAADGSARGGNSTARVARGGSYSDAADRVRSAARARLDASRGDAQTGFRVLREIN